MTTTNHSVLHGRGIPQQEVSRNCPIQHKDDKNSHALSSLNDVENGTAKSGGTFWMEDRETMGYKPPSISHGKDSSVLEETSNTTKQSVVILIAKIFSLMAILATVLAIAMTNIQTTRHQGSSLTDASHGSSVPFTDVVVIGAGWAGLKAAETLIAAGGKTVLVLEAKDYVGGRAKSNNSFVQGSPTELGCEWLYAGETEMSTHIMGKMGYDFIPIYELHGLKESSIFLSTTTRDQISGEIVKSAKVLNDTEKMVYNEKIITGYTSYLKDTSQELSNHSSGSTGEERYDESFADALEDFELQHKDQLNEQDKEVLDLFESELEIEFAGEDETLSVKELGYYAGDYYEGGMRYTSVAGAGFGNIAHEFAKPFLSSSIKLNSVVREINYGQDSVVTVLYDDENGISRKAYARAALVTVSVGVLKAGNIKFTPSLSEEKQEVIDAMGFGGLNKCIMVWDDPLDMVWPKDDLWFGLAAPGEQPYGKWTSFFNPSSYKNVPMLIGWASGEDAIAIEHQSDQEIMDDVMKSLKIMFPTISRPTKYIITRWNSDDHVKGAYAYSHVDRNMTADTAILAKNINHLWFAGEATNTQGWHATTIGAWDTGRDAALDILAFLAENK
jgi:monoamine oxidase